MHWTTYDRLVSEGEAVEEQIRLGAPFPFWLHARVLARDWLLSSAGIRTPCRPRNVAEFR